MGSPSRQVTLRLATVCGHEKMAGQLFELTVIRFGTLFNQGTNINNISLLIPSFLVKMGSYKK